MKLSEEEKEKGKSGRENGKGTGVGSHSELCDQYTAFCFFHSSSAFPFSFRYSHFIPLNAYRIPAHRRSQT